MLDLFIHPLDLVTYLFSTSKGVYRLSQMEELTFEPIPSTILGIPIEKVHKYSKTIEHLYARNNFTPVLSNNQIYSQGYFNELQAFVNAVESSQNHVLTDLQSVRSVYEVMAEIHDTITLQSNTNSIK